MWTNRIIEIINTMKASTTGCAQSTNKQRADKKLNDRWSNSGKGACTSLCVKGSFFLHREGCCLNFCRTCTSHSQSLYVDPDTSKQQKELLGSSTCQTLDETLWASHRATNRFWAWVTNLTIKKGVGGKKKYKLSGAHIKQMKNELTKEGKHP